MPIKAANGGCISASGFMKKFIIALSANRFAAGVAVLIAERGIDRHPRRGRDGGARPITELDDR
jgi:hypothetical protein